ncbi:CAP domain-containing protein [Haloglomus halophilum]|uniref:CAP domain-containing protein n=1 Tax=Haloglomus halophilum TaxID=2962672 RepID=UPI0020C9F985|nr:CAP domain-containing protein [Haloglomus halophilum]
MVRERKGVAAAIYECEHCGATPGVSYHEDGACSGAILSIGGEWRCGGCGARIAPTSRCPDCGHDIRPRKYQLPLDRHPADTTANMERAIHEATNRRREQHDLAPLSYSDHLAAVALQHSRDMAERDYFDHTSPDDEDAAGRYRRFGHDDRSVGENIARRHPLPTASATDIAAAVVDGWMNSPGHRENLLRERFEAEGLGVFVDTDGAVYATQNFR